MNTNRNCRLRTDVFLATLVLAGAILPPKLSAQATLGLSLPSGFGRTWAVDSTYGPTLGDSLFSPLSNTGYWDGSGAVQSDNGNQGYARSEWNWTAGFSGQSTALDFRGVTFTMNNRSDSLTSIGPFQGSSGSNAQLNTSFELSFTVNQDQYYRLAVDGGGYAATTAGYFGNGMAYAQALGSLTIENQNLELWNAVRENDGGAINAGHASTLYGVFHSGATHRVTLPSLYTYASTGAAANLFSGYGTSNTVCSLTSQMELTDTAQSISLSELASRDLRFVSGGFSLPALTGAETIQVTVNPEAALGIADGSLLNGSLDVQGQLNVSGNLGLSNNGIIAVGAGGIVAVGAGSGIVAPGAGGGIVNIAAGGGIVGAGGGAGIVGAGAGGMIIAPGAGGGIVAPGAGGGIVAPGAGGGIVAVGAGGYLTGNGIIGNNGNAFSANLAGSLGIGHSPGMLTVFGDVELQSTTILNFEIGGFLAGDDFDLLEVLQVNAQHGLLNLGGATLNLFILNGFESSPNLASATFDIMMAEGGVIGGFGNMLGGNRLFTSDGLGSFQVNIGSDRVTLSNFVSAVPEPSSLIYVTLVGLSLAHRRRR